MGGGWWAWEESSGHGRRAVGMGGEQWAWEERSGHGGGAHLGQLACKHGALPVGAVPGTNQLQGVHTDKPGCRSCDSHVTYSADDHQW